MGELRLFNPAIHCGVIGTGEVLHRRITKGDPASLFTQSGQAGQASAMKLALFAVIMVGIRVSAYQEVVIGVPGYQGHPFLIAWSGDILHPVVLVPLFAYSVSFTLF